jgi:hypothetical protein
MKQGSPYLRGLDIFQDNVFRKVSLSEEIPDRLQAYLSDATAFNPNPGVYVGDLSRTPAGLETRPIWARMVQSGTT